MQDDQRNPSQALLALPELPGIDGPGSHGGGEQWKLLQPVIEDYGISSLLGYFTGDNHGSNDVLCRLMSSFLESQGIAWNAKHRRIRCHGHVVNLCVQAFLFMDNKEAVLEACRQIEEMDEAPCDLDMMQGWKKRKERGWSQLGPLGKVQHFPSARRKVLGLDNDTRWNSWFLLLDTALEKEEHVKWYQDKYYETLVNDYLAPRDWQALRDIRNFLQPFWRITLLTEGYRSTLDRTLFTMDVLHKHYQQAFEKYKLNQQLLGPVLTSWHVFDKYYRLSDETPAYVRKLWEEEYMDLPTISVTPSKVSVLQQDEYDLLAQELDVIGKGPDADEYEAFTSQSPIQIDGSPLSWWHRDEHRERFPRLSKMAIDILSIPAMSADPERTFSGARRTISWDRMLLGASTVPGPADRSSGNRITAPPRKTMSFSKARPAGWRFLSRITAIGRQNRRSTPAGPPRDLRFRSRSRALRSTSLLPPPSTTSSIATVATATACTMSNAIEDPRVRAAIEHYLLDLENTQPKNTKRNYRPKQEEWKASPHARPAIFMSGVKPTGLRSRTFGRPRYQGQQLPGDLVDEGKLLPS
ncbi:Ribonuclease H-like protein [Hirsutella rhossiliensis]|uniref:Ribonuclease H-like protein n=1 Tax=Hirsutella rhossiliensis TaxID=111463 RepID=A0A9P8SD75_9HYPO|nr:Ribonuclease H-like protein [Hirsutella rhossiliensis]KAH0957035.1 Ribonuclease H-like protein [Hirsutella rhossiliensis]